MTRKPQNRVFQKFTSETSFHGFAEAERGKNGWVFTLWIFAIATFFSVFIWETYMICVEFTTTPYVTHISTEPLDILPSIGICLKYTIDETKVHESGLSNNEVAYVFGFLSGVQGINERNWNEIRNNSALFEKYAGNWTEILRNSDLLEKYELNWTEILNNASLLEKYEGNWTEILNNASLLESFNFNVSRMDEHRKKFPSYAALIQSLSREMNDDFASFTIDCPQCINARNITLTPYLKPSGICYKTSPGYLERADKRGLAVPQLQIAHTLHQYETVYGYETANEYAENTALIEGIDEDSDAADLSSLKIVVETDNTNFDDYGDVAVSAVTDGIVLLRRTRFAYKQSTGNCIPDHDLRSDRAGCLRACVNDRHAECGLDCVDYLGDEYEQQTDAVKFCLHFNRTKDQKDCIEHLTTECKEQCPQPCNKIVYDATVLPLMAEHKQTIEQYVLLNDAIMGDGTDTLFFKRIILIQPMHPDTLMVVREVAAQTGHTLLANIGGFFGLFLGGSFLSIVHLLHVFACGWLEKPDGGDSGIAGDSDSSLWSKFSNETTMHGLDHLAASSRLSAKLFWTLALAVCCSVMWWEMYELGSQFATTPYLTQVEIEPLEDFPLIGLCPDITVDARKVKQQGLTWEDAALVFGTLSKSSVVGLLGVPFNQSRLTQLRSNFATHAELVKSLSIDYTEKISAALNMNGSLHVSNIVKSGGVCLVVQIPPGRRYTEATVDFSNQFALFFETWKEIMEMEGIGQWNEKIIYNRTYNPQAGSLNVIDSKIKLMFGTQVTDFAEYGEAVISELIDATVVVQVNRKIKAYEPGRCLRAKDQRPDGVSCYDHCVFEGRKECGIDCLDYYLGEVFERYVVETTGTNITFCHEEDIGGKTDCLKSVDEQCAVQCPGLCDYNSYEANVLNLPIAKGLAAHRLTEDLNYNPLFSSMSTLHHWWPDPYYDTTTSFQFSVKIANPDRSIVIKEVTAFTANTLLANFAGLLGLFLGISTLTVAHAVYFWTCGLRQHEKKTGGAGDDDDDSTRSHAKQFMGETSIHGWEYIGNTENAKVKIFWFISIFACYGIMIWEIYLIVHQFHTEPYGTLFKDESMTHFPKVAICPADSVNPVSAWENRLSLSDLKLLFSSLTDYSGNMMAAPPLKNDTAIQRIHTARKNYGSHSALLKAVSENIDGWILAKCELCETGVIEFQKVIKSMGVCYAADPGAVLDFHDPLRNGKPPELDVTYTVPVSKDIKVAWCALFSLEYEYQQYTAAGTDVWYWEYDYFDEYYLAYFEEYYDDNYEDGCNLDQFTETVDIDLYSEFSPTAQLNSLSENMMVVFGDQIDIFDNLGDIRLSPEFDVTVSVRMIKRILIHNCVKSTPELNDDLAIPCVKACVHERSGECGSNCVEYLGERHEKITGTAHRYCFTSEAPQNDSTNQCLEELLDACSQTCPKPCEYYMYEPTVMLSPIDQIRDEYDVYDMYKAQPKPKTNTTRTIKIRPTHPEGMLVLQEVATYTGHSLLSNIGGFFGLFSGGSIVSAVHFLYFWTAGFLGRRQ